LYLLSLARQMSSIGARHPSVRSIGVAAAVGCIALLPMLFFDNLLEQPHVMVPLAILVIASRGVAGRLDIGSTALAAVRVESLERAADYPRPYSS
jgi:hypothetical protein